MTAIKAHVAPPEVAANGAADFDFAHCEIADRTVRFEMPMVSPEAYLIVRPATSENKQFNAGTLRMGGKRQRQVVQQGAMTIADVDADVEEDRVLYPKYVVVGWGGIFNKVGELVPFNLENCRAFIRKLPAYIFNRLRLFCMRPENFLPEGDAGDATPPNPVEMAEN